MKTEAQTYECANCHGVFVKINDEDWSDEKALAEYASNFPISSQKVGGAVMVCDDCYNALIAWKAPGQWEAEQS